MKFSVIIPVYNRSESLKRAIISVLDQQYKNVEILVIDDGSDPKPACEILNVISNFADKRIELIIHPINLNGAAARNTGILKSSGQFICFLDSDDTWEPQKLMVLQKTIASQVNVNKDIFIYNQYQNVDNTVKSLPIPQKGKKIGETVAHYSFITNNLGGIQTSAICISSALAKSVMFNDALKGHQDWDFALRVGKECDNFIFIRQVLTLRYRDQCNSVASSLDWLYSLFFLKEYKGYFTLGEAACFMKNAIFPKAKRANALTSLLKRPLFWQSLFIKPTLLINFIVMYKLQREALKRLELLFMYCNKNQYKKIIVWGANNYSEFIIQRTTSNIQVIAILDCKSPVSGGEFMGVPMWSITNIECGLLNSCDLLVLATDVHQESMKLHLLQKEGNKVSNIIKF